MGFVFKAIVDSILLTFGFYLFFYSLPLFGIDMFLESTFSNIGLLFTFLLVLGEVFWNRL